MAMTSGRFLGNVFTLLLGTGTAQLITFLCSPVLTRIYTPEELGAFGVYVAIVATIASCAGGNLENAVLLAEDDAGARSVQGAAVGVCLVTVGIVAAVVIGLEPQLVALLRRPELETVLLLLPASILGVALFRIFSFWFNRQNAYRRISAAQVLQSLCTNGLHIGLGFLGWTLLGLVLGPLVGYGLAALLLLVWALSQGAARTSAQQTLAALREYRSFPLYQAPATLLQNLSVNAGMLGLNFIIGAVPLGYYALAVRVLGAPLVVLKFSFLDAFSRELLNRENKTRFYCRTLALNLATMLILVAVPVLVAGPWLFGWVCGEQWRPAGELARYIVPWFVMAFGVESVLYVFAAAQRQQLWLGWQVFYLAGFGATLYAFAAMPVERLLMACSAYSVVMYLVLAGLGLRVTRDL